MNLAGNPFSCCHSVAQNLQSFFPASSKSPSQALKHHPPRAQPPHWAVSCHLHRSSPLRTGLHNLNPPRTTSRVICFLHPLFSCQAVHDTFFYYPSLHWQIILSSPFASQLLNWKGLKIPPLFVPL